MDILNINGTKYLTVKQIAQITGKPANTIKKMLYYPNRLGEFLPHIRVNMSVFVPVSGFLAYPFTGKGRSKTVVWYDVNGNIARKERIE